MRTTTLTYLRAELRRMRVAHRMGRISALKGGRILVRGLSDVAALGDRLLFPDAGTGIGGEVVEVDGQEAAVLPEVVPEGLSIGQAAIHDGPARLAPDDSWIGRVIDPEGRPLDGRPLRQGPERRRLLHAAPEPVARRGFGDRIDTGLSVFDTLLPLVRGQRIGLFAGAGVGKSTLLARLAVAVSADVVVLALVGERGREVRDFTDRVLGAEGMSRSVVIAATADRPAVMRRRAAEAATVVAEHFRDRGKHVLLLVDSITRYAEAHREIALAGGESAAMRGYPPSMAQRVMALAERAGPGAGEAGDITALFTVLVAGSDMEEPVADTLRGVLDGHVVLDRSIAERGRYPAVNVGRSVSRSLPDAASPAENQLIAEARGILAAYERSELMVQAGLHSPGADPALDRALELWPALDDFIGSSAPSDAADSFARLRACLAGEGARAA